MWYTYSLCTQVYSLFDIILADIVLRCSPRVSKNILSVLSQYDNRPFPSSLVPLFQSESKCETILMKMTLICMKIKLHAELIFISMKSYALRLILKQRHKRTQEWPFIDIPDM